MAQITVNTQSAAYANRHNQFRDIVSYWRPLIRQWIKSDQETRQIWRDNDPFLHDILRFYEAIAANLVDEV